MKSSWHTSDSNARPNYRNETLSQLMVIRSIQYFEASLIRLNDH
jgi:hypothetical protein